MTVRNIKKSLAGVEDLAIGIGKLQQERGVVHRINVFPSSHSYIDMQQYEGGDFFRLYGSDTFYTDYRRNPAGTVGIPSGAGGVWEPLLSNDKSVGGNSTNGAYLVDDSYVLWHADTASYYGWTGLFPHVVAPGTDPTAVGSGYVPLPAINLRNQLAVGTGDLIGTKYGTLNVFTDRVAYAPAVGIKTTNTPEQNTQALEVIRMSGERLSLMIPSGIYPFDVFRTSGLREVIGYGKDVTEVTLSGSSSPVSVQFVGPCIVDGIHFHSVAGSMEWQRTSLGNDVVIQNCKISGYLHTSALPNSWGIYSQGSKRCTLKNVEFEDNSQSDIAILEGTEDLVIDGCYHTNGLLHINLEPNDQSSLINNVEIRHCNIHILDVLNNSLSGYTSNVLSVNSCRIDNLNYDGLSLSLSGTRVDSLGSPMDNANRVYGDDLSGLMVSPIELISDTAISNVSDVGGSACWTRWYSTIAPALTYGRDSLGRVLLNPTNITGVVYIRCEPITVQPGEQYVVTIDRELVTNGQWPDTCAAFFYNSSGTEISAVNLCQRMDIGTRRLYRSVIVVPSAAATMRVVLKNTESNTAQSIAYGFVSVRKFTTTGNAVPCESVLGLKTNRIKLPVTYAQFAAAQYYWCPLNVGTEVEFAYAAGAVRLAVVTVKGADSASKFGTLQPVSMYP